MRRCPRCATPPTIPCDVPSAHPKRHPLGTATGPSLRLAPDAARPEPGRLHLRQSRLIHRGRRESGRRRPPRDGGGDGRSRERRPRPWGHAAALGGRVLGTLAASGSGATNSSPRQGQVAALPRGGTSRRPRSPLTPASELLGPRAPRRCIGRAHRQQRSRPSTERRGESKKVSTERGAEESTRPQAHLILMRAVTGESDATAAVRAPPPSPRALPRRPRPPPRRGAAAVGTPRPRDRPHPAPAAPSHPPNRDEVTALAAPSPPSNQDKAPTLAAPSPSQKS